MIVPSGERDERSGRVRRYREIGLTAGRGRADRRFVRPAGSNASRLETARPDGEQILTKVPRSRSLRYATLDAGTGRLGRTFADPARRGTIGTFATPGSFLDGAPFVPWHPYAPSIVVRDGPGGRVRDGRDRVSFINPTTGKKSGELEVGGRGASRACFLPSGRVLVQNLDTAPDVGPPRFFLTDRARTEGVEINSSQIGRASSITCSAGPDGETLAVVTLSGAIYEVFADAVESSPTLTAG